MWAVSERHPDAVTVLIDHGADVNAQSRFVPAANGRGFEGRTPVAPQPGQGVQEFASGWLTPLMFAAREGDLESARLVVSAGADVNAIAGDGKDALGLAIFNGNYELASFLIDNKSNVNQADTQGFTPLFWWRWALTWELVTWGKRMTAPLVQASSFSCRSTTRSA